MISAFGTKRYYLALYLATITLQQNTPSPKISIKLGMGCIAIIGPKRECNDLAEIMGKLLPLPLWSFVRLLARIAHNTSNFYTSECKCTNFYLMHKNIDK